MKTSIWVLLLLPLPTFAGVSNPAWEKSMCAAIEAAEYHATPAAGGELQAPNRAQNLRTHFRQSGIEIVPRTDSQAWQFGWETAAWGRTGHMEVLGSATRTTTGARVTYERSGLDEWYVNRARGIEQGFTVHRRPAGDGALVIEGRVQGGLRAELADGAVDFLDENGARVLRYAELHVEDAAGQVIPSWLEAKGDRLAILVDDRAATYPLTIDPLLFTPAWTAEGNQGSAQFGYSVGTAGDVNGDGYSDVIVGAIIYDNGEQDEGRAFLYLGSPAGLSTTAAWTAEANQINALFGWAVGTAGDVNGDGFSDVIVSSRIYDNGQTDEGRVFVYHGSATGLAATPAWTAEGNQMSADFGYSAGTAGDVNGDGFADVLVGARNFDNGQTDEGRAFVYLGSAAGLAANPAWTAESNQATAWFGWSSSTAGDVNGDGFADVIVGAMLYDNGQDTEGRAYVYHGSATGLGTTAAWTAESNQVGASFANSVALAGDVNGDGFGDVIIGGSLYDNGQMDEGMAFVYHGSAVGLGTVAAWTSESNQVDAEYAQSVATAGDVNGDGYADVVIGARTFANGQTGEGQAVAYQGSATGLGSVPAWSNEGNQASAEFGGAVATAGDVNGDGYSDVVVGAKLYSNGQSFEGQAFAYHGAPTGLAIGPARALEMNQGGAELGTVVAPAGDVNGDGYSDVIVGAVFYDNGETNEGAAFVYYGSRTGIGSSPNWMAEGNQADSRFGEFAAGAGDVNGDGYADLIIGAHGYDNGESSEGRVFVYHGSASGLATTAAWITEGNQMSAAWGHAVSSAGDVNGDGFADVIIGAPGFSNDTTQEGGAFVFLGSATGLAATPDWVGEGNQGTSLYGFAVSTAGDVNADGYSDVIVGSPRFNNGEFREGKAFVYHGSANGLEDVAAWTAESNLATADFGIAVAAAGDLDGDGYADVVVGASGYSNGETGEGAAFIYTGSPFGLLVTPGWIFEGNQATALFARSVATAGDVNGDGYSDLIIGAGQYNSWNGWAVVYHGGESGLGFAWDTTTNQPCLYGASVATAGDVNGDGYADVIVGAWLYDNGQGSEGSAFLYAGNGGFGLDRRPMQLRTQSFAPIGVLGRSDSPTEFTVAGLGRSAVGRTRVRLQVEVKPAGVPFDGTGLVTGPAIDTGFPLAGGSVVPLGVLVSGLVPDELVHWRLRLLGASPFAPRTPWVWQPMNGLTEPDLRTKDDLTGIADAEATPAQARWLAPSAPNPFAIATELAYTLPARGPMRLAIYDVQGRQVTQLVDGLQVAGRHAMRWDGRDTNGTPLAAGVYLVRLEFAGRVETQKLVRSR